MEIRNHVYIRYCQRFLGMKDIEEKDIKKYIFENKTKLTEKIFEIKNKSKLVWSGTIVDQEFANYYLFENIIIVECLNPEKLVTIYNLDYGYGEVTDREIIKSLSNEINKIDNKIEKTKAKNSKLITIKENELNLINTEIKTLEEQLKILQMQKDNIQNDILVINSKLDYLNLERDCLGRKLISSVNLKMKLLEGKCNGNGVTK